ncbi:MAG: hypothetical protein ACO1RX_12640 [Candidatus Sericytochromatia bacterium]
MLTCKKCHRILSVPLEPVAANFQPQFIDNQNVIPRGHFWIAHGLENEDLTGHVVIHLEDPLNLKPHPDFRRSVGCCGKDGCDGPNLICPCKVPVATERSDCWTSFYIHFEPDKVTLETV